MQQGITAGTVLAILIPVFMATCCCFANMRYGEGLFNRDDEDDDDDDQGHVDRDRSLKDPSAPKFDVHGPSHSNASTVKMKKSDASSTRTNSSKGGSSGYSTIRIADEPERVSGRTDNQIEGNAMYENLSQFNKERPDSNIYQFNDKKSSSDIPRNAEEMRRDPHSRKFGNSSTGSSFSSDYVLDSNIGPRKGDIELNPLARKPTNSSTGSSYNGNNVDNYLDAPRTAEEMRKKQSSYPSSTESSFNNKEIKDSSARSKKAGIKKNPLARLLSNISSTSSHENNDMKDSSTKPRRAEVMSHPALSEEDISSSDENIVENSVRVKRNQDEYDSVHSAYPSSTGSSFNNKEIKDSSARSKKAQIKKNPVARILGNISRTSSIESDAKDSSVRVRKAEFKTKPVKRTHTNLSSTSSHENNEMQDSSTRPRRAEIMSYPGLEDIYSSDEDIAEHDSLPRVTNAKHVEKPPRSSKMLEVRTISHTESNV